MFKTILIIFLVLAAVGVAGGSYYYFEVYSPEKYAGAVLSLYQKLESAGLEPDASSLKNASDYENALRVLNEKISLLNSIKSDLAAVEVPKRMENFQNEFMNYIDFLLPRHEHAKDLAEFLSSANVLHEAFEALDEQRAPSSPTQPAADFQELFAKRFSKIQSAGREFARKEVEVVTDPSFSELKTLWEGASPGFDLVLKKISQLNPKLPASQMMNNLFTPSEQKQLDSYTPKVEGLSKKLDDLVKKYQAYDILAFKYFPDSTSAEASERSLKFYNTLQELKAKYGTR
ncbi:MAG: hypothetical protein HYT98_02715 [Candidatus Sungbacteria bacterium]|nr:hypothetical protein [Candidatus Sungbacteria bacterium]